MSLPAVAILAGGLATRLGSLTEKTPKSLLQVAGQPFIHHQLQLLARLGVQDVVLCLGHLGERVQAFCGDGSAFGLKLSYSFDGPTLLGTGGALKQALPLLSDPFFVLYGDSYLDLALQPVLDAYLRQGQPALMTVFKNDGRYDQSNVRFEGGRILGYAKGAPDAAQHHIDYGLGLLAKGALAQEPPAFDLAAFYGKLVRTGQLAGYEVQQRFYEIGSAQGLAETDALLRRA